MSSARDLQGAREFRAFLAAEEKAEREKENRAEYNRQAELLNTENRGQPLAFQVPVPTFEEFVAAMDNSEQNAQFRAVKAMNTAILRRERQKEQDAVAAGKPDPGFATPASTSTLRMHSMDEAREFNARTLHAFIRRNPGFFGPDHLDMMTNYGEQHGLKIIDEAAWQAIFDRCLALGLISEHEPEPELVQEPAEVEPISEPETFQGWDTRTGEPRTYTTREVQLMSSDELRRAFKLCGENTPVLLKTRYR